MYITQLEIDNFKSFGKKTKIPFFEGFTVISGPNGSGKSNIIDSILFCLALSGARGLRAEKLTDLINLNSGKNSAEVTISFSDGTRIRRRIKRTPHGYYSYNYLNDRLCKQGDILEFLGKFGIKPEGYNVVMQGDITRIMEMSDTERRRIVDEIAGVAEFDKKKEQALAELEVVRERIDREELLLHELSIRLEELQNEREQALKYQRLSEELEFFRNCRSAAELRERERELAALQHLIFEQEKALVRTGDQQQEAEDAVADQKTKIEAVDGEINEKSGTEYLQLLTGLEEAKGAIKLAEKTISRLLEDKQSNLESIQRIYMDTKRAESRVRENTESIRTLSIDRSNIAMELATKKAERENLEEQLKAESAEVAGARDHLFSRMKDLEEERGKRSELLHRQDMLIEKSRMRSSEKERLENRLSQIEIEREEKEFQCGDFADNIVRLKKEKSDLEQKLSTLEKSLLSYRSSIEALQKEIKSRERELMRLEAQQQAGGAAGSQALEAILGMDGVYGTIAQLGKVSPEYAQALNVAAGNRLQHVVVESDAIAAEAIAFLKTNRLGRITFLPLNKLKVPDLPELRDRNVINYAINLLEYDPLFDLAIRQVFGATVVVDTLERARKMMGRYRMVTLEGELIEKAGAMTGGSRPKKSIGFGVAADEEIANLRSEITRLDGEIRDLEAGAARLSGESEKHRRERSAIEEQIARFSMLQKEYGRQLGALGEERGGISSSLDALAAEVLQGGAQLMEIEQEIDAVTEIISDISNEVDELKKRLEDTAIPGLTERIERIVKEVEEYERRLRNKDADIADVQRERQHFSRRVEELDQERAQIEEKNARIEAEISGAEASIEENRKCIADLELRQQTFSSELERLRARRDKLTAELLKREKRLMEHQSKADQIRLQITSLQERRVILEGEVTSLREEVGNLETDLSLQEIEDGVARAEYGLKRIGAVNMLAIEEYERVQGRISDRTEKKDVLSRERTMLIERIGKYEQMKFHSFIEAYNAIDVNFRQIFARLTSGSGQLLLENEDDPFSGGMTFAVKPRDKVIHLLSSLSGGEKSLTTLAFIFAIQQYTPAPFYALDEIDMFLDTSNVERIATLIKELSSNAQSIIVSLRKPTIERADRLVGVTLQPDKMSFVTGIKSNG